MSILLVNPLDLFSVRCRTEGIEIRAPVDRDGWAIPQGAQSC